MPGPIFGKYEVIRRLAVGGMGEVFLARQTGIPGFERHAILKSLLPDVAEQAGAIEEFLDEARVAATLNHPNLVSIYEVGLWEGVYYIAMEYIDGDDLAGLRKAALVCGQFLPFEVTARIVHDAAEGLDHAHRAHDMSGKAMEIVHRDISPQNIMVRRDGVTKVVDFGIARAANRSTRTKTGMTKGKLAYMPPEQVRGQKVDGRSDQYALGVVLWELLTGKRLFVGDSDVDLIKQVLRGQIPKPSEVDPSVPLELEAIALQMMSRDPAGRFASCRDVGTALIGWLDRVAPGMGTGEVSQFVVAVFDGWRAKSEKPTRPNENFVIDLQAAAVGPSEHPVLTRPQNSQLLAAASAVGGFAAINTGDLASIKPRLASSSAEEAVAAPVGPTPPPSPAQLSPATVTAARRPGALIAVTAGIAAVALAIGAVRHAIHRSDPPSVPVAAYLPRAPAPRLPPPPPLPAAQLRTIPASGTIAVDGPAGAQIAIDGKAWAQKAPCEIAGLKPGAHRLQLAVAQGALPEEVVTLAEPPRATLRLESIPSGAEVVLAGQILGTTPFESDHLPPDVAQELELRLAGYRPEPQTVRVSPGMISNVQVTLHPLASKGKPSSKPVPAVAAVAPTITPPATFGYLSLDTKPWTQVEIDGEGQGPTPLLNKKLSTGSHRVVMVNEGANINSTKTVTIKPDDTTKLILQLP